MYYIQSKAKERGEKLNGDDERTSNIIRARVCWKETKSWQETSPLGFEP
jgi:hypothetical protein